jgi:hypothetical protein
VVVVRDHRARRSPLRLAGHECEATQESSPAAARLVTVCRADTGRVARVPRRAAWKDVLRARRASGLGMGIEGVLRDRG